MRFMPFVKGKKGFQIAGGGVSDSGGGGGGSYVLPPATSSTLGGVKIGNGVNVTSDGTISVSGGGGGSLPDYSTTEFDTGRKWIDGKTIYGRVYEFNSDTSFTKNSWNETYLNGGIDFHTINGMLYTADGACMSGMMSFCDHNSGQFKVYPFRDITNCRKLYFEYTKGN